MSLASWCRLGCFGLLVMTALPSAAWAVGEGCVRDCSKYDPGISPTCNRPATITWSDGCTGTCSRSYSAGDWVPDVSQFPCGQPVVQHRRFCLSTTRVAKNNCPKDKSAKEKDKAGKADRDDDTTGYVPFGFAVPGHETYGFTSSKQFVTQYPRPEQADLLGLAAKGNIIVGDYTSAQFKAHVLPKLRPTSQESVVQPYAVDASDAALGYTTYTDAGGQPVFNGNYDREDDPVNHPGRKFYESSLSDADFLRLINRTDPLLIDSGNARIDAVLYTNHAIAGYVAKDMKLTGDNRVDINGSMVSRDDALIVDANFAINHDIRLAGQHNTIGLPLTLARPELLSWQECPAAGCP